MIWVIANILVHALGVLIYILAWLRIGRLTKLGFLTAMSCVGIIIHALLILTYSHILITPSIKEICDLAQFVLVASGIFVILFGLGILPLKQWFGRFATTVGIVNIVTGACLVVLCLPIGMIGAVVMAILEIILFFRAAKKLAS